MRPKFQDAVPATPGIDVHSPFVDVKPRRRPSRQRQPTKTVPTAALDADVANACGAAVLLVGKEGLGDCVDTYCLNAGLFEQRGVRVLGIIINRVQDSAKLIEKTQLVRTYFERHRPEQKVYALLKGSLSATSRSCGVGVTSQLAWALERILGVKRGGQKVLLELPDDSCRRYLILHPQTKGQK